jgi:hypothetical protein
MGLKNRWILFSDGKLFIFATRFLFYQKKSGNKLLQEYEEKCE